MQAWRNWLAHLIDIEKVTCSSQVVCTTFWSCSSILVEPSRDMGTVVGSSPAPTTKFKVD
jgi:hypothetical protein